ncbi:MAG: antibiotic biosynthesis monooxygenase family protein [Desulfobulbaceae bacterium]
MTVIAKIKPEKRNEFLDAMRSLQKERLAEPGISISQVYEDWEDPYRFVLMDEWETEDDMQRFLGKESFSVLMGALRTLGAEVEVKLTRLVEKRRFGSAALNDGGQVSTVFKNDGKVGENRPEQRGKEKGAPSRFLAET